MVRPTSGLERTGEQVLTTVTDVRRQINISLIRLQARLDNPILDRVLPWLAASILGLILSVLALARYQDLGVGEQLGHYLQAVHLMDLGLPPIVSELGMDIFAVQAAWIVWPIAWLTGALPAAKTMLTIQSVGLGLGVVPLWRIARGPANLRMGPASALVLAYALHPSIQNLNLSGFHPEALAIPALMAAYLVGHRRRWVLLVLLISLVLSTRADLGLAIFALGIIMVAENQRRPGWFVAGVGLSWFLAMAFVVQPALSDGSYPHLEAFSSFGAGVVDVLIGMLADPVGFVSDLLERGSIEKLLLLVGPVLFLPLIRPRYLLPLLPLMSLYLVADVSDDGFGNPQQDVAAVVLVFIATTWALARIGTAGFSRVMVDRRVLAVLVLTAGVFFIRDAASSPYEEPWGWGRRDSVDVARVAATGWVPAGASVLAAPTVYPLLANREEVRVFRLSEPTTPEAMGLANMDVLVFDHNELDWLRLEIIQFEESLHELMFRRQYDNEGVQVWTRERLSG